MLAFAFGIALIVTIGGDRWIDFDFENDAWLVFGGRIVGFAVGRRRRNGGCGRRCGRRRRIR